MTPKNLFLGAALAIAPFAVSAQVAPGTVEVTDVDFAQNVGGPGWTSMAVEIVADTPRGTDYLNDVKVTLLIAYQVDNDTVIFFESSATVIALEDGVDKNVVFLLPGEIEEQFNLPEEPSYWLIDIEVGGEEVPVEEGGMRFSRGMEDAAFRESMRSSARGELGNTEGMLLPIYLTPYPETLIENDPPPYRRFQRQP